MSEPRTPTLDQLQVFLATVEAGSFAAAARQLGRATSVVSYQIANLETQLSLTLFDRHSTRRPLLTDAGRAVLADVRIVATGLDALLAKARGLVAGLEAEVTLAVDVMLPSALLVEVLEAFNATYPTVGLRLQVEALGAVTQLVLDGKAQVGVSGVFAAGRDELERKQLGAIRLIAVAAPTHPLARHKGPIPTALARGHVQLVLTDRSRLTDGRDFAVLATHTWRLADLSAKHALLVAGLGWGSMPEAMVQDDLTSGRLSRIAIDEWDNVRFALQSVYRTDTPPGPAGRWLLDRLTHLNWQRLNV